MYYDENNLKAVESDRAYKNRILSELSQDICGHCAHFYYNSDPCPHNAIHKEEIAKGNFSIRSTYPICDRYYRSANARENTLLYRRLVEELDEQIVVLKLVSDRG